MVGSRLPGATAAFVSWNLVAGVPVVQFQRAVLRAQATARTESAPDAGFYLERGEAAAGAHDYDRAIADYSTAIELNPASAEAFNDRGFAYYLQGKSDRAIADFTRAIELRPDYPKAYNSRGVVFMAGGYGRERAVADFDRAIALQPDFRYAYINRANAHLFRHPLLALSDFHRAGMYPERRVAVFGVVILTLCAGLAMLRRRRRVATAGTSGRAG
jgi:tetratricopeptide (TPR) repeat protein